MVLGCKFERGNFKWQKKNTFSAKTMNSISFSIASCHLKLMYTALPPNKTIIEQNL